MGFKSYAERFFTRDGVPNDGSSTSWKKDQTMIADARSSVNSTQYRPFGVPQTRKAERSGAISNLAGAATVTVAGGLSVMSNAFSTTTVIRFARISLAGKVKNGAVADGRFVPSQRHW